MGCSSSTQSGEGQKKSVSGLSFNSKNKPIIKYNSSSQPGEFVFKNFSLSQDSFFDLLEEIENFQNMKTFIVDSVIINLKLNKLTKILDKVSKNATTLKVLHLNALHEFGEKKGRYILMVAQTCPNLSELILRSIELDDSDTESLVKIITQNSPNLTHLDLSFNTFEETKQELLTSFIQNTSLKSLVLQSMKIDECTDLLVTSLENCKKLELLDLSQNKIQQHISSLNNLFFFEGFEGAKLKTLKLDNCSLEDGGFGILAEILLQNRTLESLSVKQNGFTAMIGVSLKKLFESNQTLSLIDLQQNNIYQKDLTPYLYDSDLIKCSLDDYQL